MYVLYSNYLLFYSPVDREDEMEMTSLNSKGHMELPCQDGDKQLELQRSSNQHDRKQSEVEFQRIPEENQDCYNKPPRIDFDEDRFR